ncbi:MAG: hypothetical protein GOU99_03660 [Candidatus Altiarchaeota archaeon]|nr:hypothetical protein [Candidatus Altiarchaeota archaeon]
MDDKQLSYWVHKVQGMWRELEDLKKRVIELEKRPAMNIPAVSKPITKLAEPARPALAADQAVALLHERGPMNIIDINTALKEHGVNETVRETLFNRMKLLIKEGKVKYNESTQQFSAS